MDEDVVFVGAVIPETVVVGALGMVGFDVFGADFVEDDILALGDDPVEEDLFHDVNEDFLVDDEEELLEVFVIEDLRHGEEELDERIERLVGL